jgi:dihydrofolate reductase
MPKTKAQIAVSLDGYMAAPNQSEANPIGEGGHALHEWIFKLASFSSEHGMGDDGETGVSDDVLKAAQANIGAVVMGRNMFGPVRGAWGDSDWRGWWGPEPPYHAPVFVLTHHVHDPIEMEGGTTFSFVDSFETALAEAAKQAGDRPIDIAGGAGAVRQALQARCLNELVLDIVPVLLRQGERIFDDVPDFDAEAVEAATSPLATHVVYKIT